MTTKTMTIKTMNSITANTTTTKTMTQIWHSQSSLGLCQTTSKNQTMLVVLSLSYAIFTGSLSPVEMGMQVGLISF